MDMQRGVAIPAHKGLFRGFMQKKTNPAENSDGPRILIIDDDVELCELIAEFLRPEGFQVDAIHSGTQALEKALGENYSLLILDVMLPGSRGFEVLQKLRAKSRVPVIMLTARGDEVDRILGLEIGADDYLPKPFNPRELAARIHAVLRRTPAVSSAESASLQSVRVCDIEFNPGSRSVLRNSRPVELTSVEFDLLGVFLRSPGQVLQREVLAREVLGRDLSAFDRSIDVHVSNLRRKLGPLPGGGERIKAVRGAGYLYALGEKTRKSGFEELLAHGRGTFPWHPFLFDRNGHEVLESKVSPQVTQAMQLAMMSKQTEIVRQGDGRAVGQYVTANSGTPYVLVLEMSHHGPEGGPHVPSQIQLLQFLIVLLIVGLISLWITRHIPSPIFLLRAAANQLARGNLSVRVTPEALHRKDELASLGKDFNHMAEQIDLLMTAKRRLIADISHELRSPLARLSVALGLAKRTAAPEMDAALNRIERETQRLNELIGGLLNLARLESGAETLDQGAVQLDELVKSLADDAAFEASSHNRSVRVLSTFACQRRGNAQLLRSAIENVARNAVSYTAEDTEVEISLNPLADGRSAVLTIRDHGPGVPESALTTIFEPFFRVDDARDRLSGGAGLGLSITDRVIRAHGGTVQAHNHPEGGLVIEITLPLAQLV